MTKQATRPAPVNDIRKLHILMIDDNSKVISSLHYHFADMSGYHNISFANNGVEAEKFINEHLSVISCDFYLNSIARFDGIGLLEYLTEKFPHIKKIIYTQSEDHELAEIRERCNLLGIEIVRKTDDHKNLEQALEKYYHSSMGLPLQPKYAFMNEKELLLALSEELLSDLSKMKNPEDKVYLSGQNFPVTIRELIGHVRNLSPLGKEYLGIWFAGQRKTMAYYETFIQSNAKL